MRSFRIHRNRSVAVQVAVLALFLLGSNYCVLGGLSRGTAMACTAVPGDAASAAVPACHGAAPSADHRSGESAAKRSCCPDPAVTPAVPVIEKADGSFTPLAHAVLATIISSPSTPAIDRHGQRSAPDGQPPPRLIAAPAPARAPPLA